MGEIELLPGVLGGRLSPVQALLNARGEGAADFPVPPAGLGELLGLVEDATISDTVAKRVLETMADEGRSAGEIVAAEGLEQVRDDEALLEWVDAVCGEFAEEARRYGEGETRILGFLVGQVMRRSGGAADPRRVNELLRERLGEGEGRRE